VWTEDGAKGAKILDQSKAPLFIGIQLLVKDVMEKNKASFGTTPSSYFSGRIKRVVPNAAKSVEVILV
jgi:hypothetical protein